MGKLADITIDGVVYPCDAWEVVQQGKNLSRSFNRGFPHGMGHVTYGDPRGYYHCMNLDPSAGPYIRMRPALDFDISATNIDPLKPMYAFIAEDTGGTDYAYILNGRYGYKIDIATGLADETKDFGANSVCGRPALFEGKWRIPLGDTNDAQTLDTINVPANADTYAAITGIKARHFAALQDETVANLAAAITYTIKMSADASSFGSAFEVGDSSLSISDLLVVDGELMPIKPDGPWSFDADGNSLPIIETLGRSLLADEYDGGNSYGHGPYGYWVGAQGLWRVLGQRAKPIGPENDPTWAVLPTMSSSTPRVGWSNQMHWASAAAWSRWFYGSILMPITQVKGDVYFGYIQDDGTVLWHGALYQRSATTNARIRAAITGPVGGTGGPILWMVSGGTTGGGTGKIQGIKLEADGSPRTQISANDRGAVSLTAYFNPSEDDFDLPDKEKQLRRMWAYVEGLPGDSTATIKLGALLDGGVVGFVGAALTATSGYMSRDATPGSSDTFFRMLPQLEFVTTAGYDPTSYDPRIRAFGYEARTASIYRCRIPATAEGLRGYSSSVPDALDALRVLVGATRVAVFEPEFNASFNGEIVSVQEKAIPDEGGVGYEVDVFIQRWGVP